MAGKGVVLRFDPAEHSAAIPYLAAIHASCITHDRTIATFLPPLSHEKLLTWWKERIAEINDGTRVMYLLLDADTTGKLKGPEIMGVVMLYMPPSETGPFRGIVEKLLVHKSFRGRGGARALMDVLEADALERGRGLLVSVNLPRVTFVFIIVANEKHSFLTPRLAAQRKLFIQSLDGRSWARCPSMESVPRASSRTGRFFTSNYDERHIHWYDFTDLGPIRLDRRLATDFTRPTRFPIHFICEDINYNCF